MGFFNIFGKKKKKNTGQLDPDEDFYVFMDMEDEAHAAKEEDDSYDNYTIEDEDRDKDGAGYYDDSVYDEDVWDDID